MSKKHAIQCKYCDKVIHGGITRVKYHLANIGGFNVTKCKKVPAHVKQEMEALLTKKTGEKEQRKKEKQRERDEIDLDKSDGSDEEENEHENDVIVLKSTRESNNCSSSRPPTNGGSGTIDNFYKPQSVEESVHKNKIQTKLSTQKREDRRDRASGIAHNTLTLPSFGHMLEAIGAFGRGLRGPSAYEMSGPFLKRAKQKPLANVLRRMDSDVPAMGFFHGCMLEAKKEIATRFDNNESKYRAAWDIIDKRWDNKLKTPLHLAGYYLNPYFYYPNKSSIELDGSFRAAVISCITKMFDDEDTQDSIIEELNIYQDQQGAFGHDIAVRQRRNKTFNPAKWWMNHGTTTPHLRILATRILNLTCSSSGCERAWSVFEQIHTKKRNKLLHDRMRDLVFVKFNSKLREKRDNKIKDPIEKELNDILEDDGNEFITGVVPDENVDQDEDQEGAHDEPSPEPTISKTQLPAKRKRHGRPRKKKLRSLKSLLSGDLERATCASSSESEDNESMQIEASNSDSGDE
ncbi:hAT transposon superfamily protein [Zea mays]|uniref:HAT transposon superfamily protein n=1 Tax=Zea mays TaxID=4577 RepID=A0A1D6NR52_MAIZE|nr:hAT transposon superfamily protein [Zea mays]